MKKAVVLLMMQIAFCAGCLHAQLTFLTLRESESLVERIPEVVNAEKNGECPSLAPSFDTPEGLSFQVRNTCGATGGMLINNYTVNRRTGEVTLWGDDRKRVLDAEGRAFARQLVEQARQRILSEGEAQCLALEAAKSLSRWNEADAVVSVVRFGGSNTLVSKQNTFDGTMYFIASRSNQTRPTESGRMLTVDLKNALVRDNETGLNVMSAGLGALTSKMVELRRPLWLSDEDALSIALRIPDVKRWLKSDCKVHGGGAERSTRTLIGLSCAGKSVEGAIVSIDLRTGEATDLATGKSLDSPEIRQLARERLAQIQQRRAELEKEVKADCHPE